MATGQQIVTSAQTWVTDKVPYVWGGITKAGADCSGYVQNVLAGLGITVGRTVGEQATQGNAVSLGPSSNPLANAMPGDVLIFGGNKHEGIYVGNGQMVDEPHSGAVASQRKVWFGGSEPLTGIRRFSTGNASTPIGTPVGTQPVDYTATPVSLGSDVGSAILEPFKSLGGSASIQEVMVRGGLMVMGAVIIIVALHALTSSSETPIGVAGDGGKAAGQRAKSTVKRGATAAVVVPK